MKKGALRITIIGGVILVIAAILLILNPFSKDIWDVNAEKLSSSFNVISGSEARIDDLSGFTPFEWDTLYSFSPYTSKDTVYNTVGYKWDTISETVNEGMNQIVFLKDGKVVCYIYGYPNKSKLYFNFGQYDGSYFKLTAFDNLSFNMKLGNDGIRYFDYIK